MCHAIRSSVRPFAPLSLLLLVVLLFATRPASAANGSVSMLVKTRVNLTPAVVASITDKSIRVAYVWPEIRAMSVVISPRKVADLQANPDVELVEPDIEAGVTTAPPSDLSGSAMTAVPLGSSTTPIVTWNQDMANTAGSSETGRGVTVVVLDSGLPQNWSDFLPAGSVDLEHAAGFGAEGWGDFHSQNNAIRGVGGHIGLFPHGLAVSSVIVGFPSDAGFVAGAAPDARILPIRCLNQFNFGWFSWFVAGILHVADLKASGALPGPVVINFSIQASGSSQVLASAIDYALARGVLFVTIAGNFHPDDIISFPGRLPQCITAGAAGWRSEGLPPQPWFFGDVPEGDASQVYVAPFSGREPPFVTPGSLIDVVAPGSFVFGEWLFGPGFSEGRAVGFEAVDNFIFGTSFAAPHVAGVVARMLEKNPGLTQAQAEAALRSSALPIPPSATPFVTPLGFFILPWDARATGAGLLQGAEAVAATTAPSLARAFYREGAVGSSGAGLGLRLLSHRGALPVEFGVRGMPVGAILQIFDVRGRLVRGGINMPQGMSKWDGRRDDGLPATSGIYFAQVRSGENSSVVKVLVAR
jgi:subtilisin family serine protease